MTTPTFSQFQQNVQRQTREQRAVGSLLSGIAAILLGTIVLVALLAGIGGWVLYNQIKTQSVTVQQLEINLSSDIRDLRAGLRETANIVEKLAQQNQTQFQVHKQQIASLQTQTDELRSQIRKQRDTTQAAIQNLQRRVFELERR